MPDLPSVKPRDVQRVLERRGWEWKRSAGSHRIFKHPTLTGTVTLPWHARRDVAKGTLRAILEDAGITEEQFRDEV